MVDDHRYQRRAAHEVDGLDAGFVLGGAVCIKSSRVPLTLEADRPAAFSTVCWFSTKTTRLSSTCITSTPTAHRSLAIGLGTFSLEGEDCVHMVREALERGYRHIDTASMYGNEAEVGHGNSRGRTVRATNSS